MQIDNFEDNEGSIFSSTTRRFPKITIDTYENEVKVPNSFDFLNPEYAIQYFLSKEGMTTNLTSIVITRSDEQVVYERGNNGWSETITNEYGDVEMRKVT